MSSERLTIGQSIDQLISALEPLDGSARRTALLAVCAHLKIQIASPLDTGAVTPDASPSQSTALPSKGSITPKGTPADIRTLKNEKSPSNSIQMACIVAFFLRELAQGEERKETVSASDLERYFKQASFKLPSRISQTLIDAKAAGYLDSVGRGEYKLNAVGYNLVAHNLPVKKE